MSAPLKARRLTDPEGQKLQRIVRRGSTHPTKLGLPFTRWSLRKLAAYLARRPGPGLRIGRESLRALLHRNGITFQRTTTWKDSPDTEADAKLDRIEHVMEHFPDRVFAFDEFGPLSIRPTAGSGWARQGRPDQLPATYRRTHGITYFHGCYSVGSDTLWGINHRRKGGANTLKALKSIRAARPDGAPFYVILDNLSAHKGPAVRSWARRNKVEFTDPGRGTYEVARVLATREALTGLRLLLPRLAGFVLANVHGLLALIDPAGGTDGAEERPGAVDVRIPRPHPSGVGEEREDMRRVTAGWPAFPASAGRSRPGS